MRTGTPFASTAARDLAVAKIDAIALHYTHIGTDYSLYNRSASPFADAAAYKTAIDACTTPDEVAAIRDAIVRLTPAKGGFYRIKGYSGNYITSNTTDNNAAMNSTANANNIIYYSEGGNLIFYGSGYGLYNTSNVAPVGTALNVYTFLQVAQSDKFYICSNASGIGTYCYDNTSSGTKLDRNSSPVTSGSYQTDWSVEAVESLPVGITSIDGRGFASFYTPVSISSLPSGVKAYIATIENDRVQFSAIDDIPAGTAVVLYMPTCDANTTVELPIGDASASTEGNVLLGTAATVAPAGKVLTMQNGTKGIGFYGFNGDYLAGFKAYINSTSGIKGFSFDFEDSADGIETIQNAETNAHMNVYDLQGRKVNANGKLPKGIYIENGKKVLK